MKFLSTTFTIATLVASALAQLTINTPASVVECEPVLLSWTSGTPPYYLSILPGGQPSASPLYQFPTQTGTSVTWVVNLAAGTSIGLTLRDSTGTTAQSAPFTILAGTSTSCLNSNATTSATTGAGSTTAGSPSTTAAGSTTGTSTTPGSTTSTPGTSPTLPGTTSHATASGTSPASTTHTTAPASSTTAASGASSAFLVHGGVVAVVGAAVAALLA